MAAVPAGVALARVQHLERIEPRLKCEGNRGNGLLRIDPIFTKLVNLCWSLFKAILLLGSVCALAVGGYLYLKLDDEIRRQVEMRFAKHYTNYVVCVGSARFDPDRGIAIDDLSIAPRLPDGTADQPVLSIEEMYLAGNLRIEKLLTNQLAIDTVIVRKATLRAVRHADGTWNTAPLLPLPQFGDHSPKVTIQDATATIEDATVPGAKPWRVRGANLTMVPRSSLSTGTVNQASGDLLAGNSPPAKVARYTIEGTANGLRAREIRVQGELGTNDGWLDLAVFMVGLDLSHELLSDLPTGVGAPLAGVEFAGQADLSMKLARQATGEPLRWSAAFSVDRGKLTHPNLPEPMTEISVAGSADAAQLSIQRLSARFGAAQIALALNRKGWGSDAPLAASARVVGYQLTEKLEQTLPESKARIWKRFRPLGPVDVELQLTFDGSHWKPAATARCRGISLTDMAKFPYVVGQTHGTVTYSSATGDQADRLRLELVGVGAGRPIHIEADLTHLTPGEPTGPVMGEGIAGDEASREAGGHIAGYRGGAIAGGPPTSVSHPAGYVTVSGTDIPLHEELYAALPEKAQKLVRSLHGQGAIDFTFRAEWKTPSQERAEVTQDIRLKDCRIEYESFPFPLQHVQGMVAQRNSRWELIDVQARGSYEATSVSCRGGVLPHDSGCEADLWFEAMNVPLDDNLRRALTPPGQRAWEELNPQGSIDFTAHVTREPNELEPNVQVSMRPRAHTVSIEPRAFRYRLSELTGEAAYERGHVLWRNLAARHGHSIVTVGSGGWQLTPDGGWACQLENVDVDRLINDSDLIRAVPVGVQAVLTKVQSVGSIGLHQGNFAFAKFPQSEVITSAWDLGLECHQAALHGPIPLRGISGGIRLVGQSDGRNAFSAGELALDSVMWKDIQFTNVRGPFWADAAHCLLGEPACQQQKQPPRRLVADTYGGSLGTNIELTHGSAPTYTLDAHLGGVNLARFINERSGGPNEMNGIVSGKLVLSGTGSSTHTLRGTGELHVVDANIYELPVLVAMLKVLRNRTPDTTAFNRCDMQFSIQGEHVHFQQLNLLGDAVSLYGNGETDFNRRLDLLFYTMLGPTEIPIPLWRTIAGHVSSQGLQLKVVGTLDDPKIERKALPAVNDMLNQLQTDLQDSAATIAPASATRNPRSLTR
ncbi:MAG: hypothetical protein IT425_12880 [Pirellulales bacterium]|nr:hypothetical protein [Pirellulales bacterium]